MEAAMEMVARVNNMQSTVEINKHQCKRLAKVYEEIGWHLNAKGNSMNPSVNMEPLLKVMEAGELLISQCAGADWFRSVLISADNREAFEEVHGDLHLWFKILFSTELVTSKLTPITDAVHDIQAMLMKLNSIQMKGGKQPIPMSSLTVALFKVETRAHLLEELQLVTIQELREERKEEKKEGIREEIYESKIGLHGWTKTIKKRKVREEIREEEEEVREPGHEFIIAPDGNLGPGGEVGSTSPYSPFIHPEPFTFRLPIHWTSASLAIRIAPDLAIPMAEITVKETSSLGTGSTAEVKEADWLGIPHAVKIYHNQNQFLMRAEVEVHQKLRSVYVVKLVGLAVEGNTCMILMELMHFNLHDLILSKRRRPQSWISNMLFKHRPPFRLQNAVGLMLQIAKGMNYMHNLHYLHGDLKTENVLGLHIGEDNYRLKISDFGISVKLSSENPTVSGQRGSSVYRAPEVLRGDVDYSLEADVYSFAMVSYEILTGRRSFEEQPFSSALRTAVINGRRPRLPCNLHRSLRHLVQRCWSSDQQLRPKFSEICQDLELLQMALVCNPRSKWTRVWAFFLLLGVFAFLWCLRLNSR